MGYVLCMVVGGAGFVGGLYGCMCGVGVLSIIVYMSWSGGLVWFVNHIMDVYEMVIHRLNRGGGNKV